METTFRLDPDDIIRAVEYQTGQRGLCDAGLRERLSNIIAELDPQAALSREEAKVARAQMIRALMTRVRLEADRRRIPAIAEEVIERPIFVIGYMRTGTTVLHSLLAEDPANRAPLWWHSHEPCPPPGEMPVAEGRMASATRELERMLDAAPALLTMHPYWDKGALSQIEDDEIYAMDFQSSYPTLFFQVPTIQVSAALKDPAGAYAFHKQFLQHLQWNQPRRRWVVKGVMHQFFLKTLFEVYPDAICVWPHRDPTETLSSALAIMAVLYGALDHGRTDWRQYAQAFAEGMGQAMQAVLQDPLVDDPRIVHLRFKDLIKDPLQALKGVYRKFDLPCTPEFEQGVQAWLASPANRPDRYGRYPYSLDLFGLKAADTARMFTDYSQRFGLD